jgi:hypothetical protein
MVRITQIIVSASEDISEQNNWKLGFGSDENNTVFEVYLFTDYFCCLLRMQQLSGKLCRPFSLVSVDQWKWRYCLRRVRRSHSMRRLNKIKFALALYWDEATETPTTYRMARVYVAKGDERTVNSGTWTITQGTELDPGESVYQLDANVPEEFRSFWAIGEELLVILDPDLNPRVGDGTYSYVLNRKR